MDGRASGMAQRLTGMEVCSELGILCCKGIRELVKDEIGRWTALGRVGKELSHQRVTSLRTILSCSQWTNTVAISDNGVYVRRRRVLH